MAIALDTTTIGTGTSGTSSSFSHTCTGTNLILFVQVGSQGSTQTVSGVTYNGVSMTQINSTFHSGVRTTTLFYLLNPATGSNTVTISMTGNVFQLGIAASYTGVKQSGQPDANSIKGPTTTTSYSDSVTTVADNCWTIMGGVDENASTLSNGTGTVVRQQDTVNGYGFLCDSNTLIHPAGSTSLTVTSASQTFLSVMASFAPYLPTAFTLTAAQGSFTLTGKNSVFNRAIHTTLTTGIYVLTGQTAVIHKIINYIISTVTGFFNLTGFAARMPAFWSKITKHSASFSTQNKNSATFTKQSKNSSSWTNITKS